MASPADAVTIRHTVSQGDTAAAVGSGDVLVLATPRIIAWLEAATVLAAAPLLATEETSVGTEIHIRHRRPSQVGEEVEVTASPPERDGRLLSFAVSATDRAGLILAEGDIQRVIVERSRFPA